MAKDKSSPKKKSTKTKNAKIPARKLRNEKDIAMDMAIEIHKKFETLVKATILFGSQAKNKATSSSDIDLIVVVDDASINWDLELIAWYREELGKIVAANKHSKDLHINTVKLTTWWNDLMHGDPVIINVLRYGEPLIDSGGFFKPIKSLLLQGKIHSTPEAVYAALQRAPAHLRRSNIAEISAIEGVYWTMVDSAQAALMTIGKLPPSPEHVAMMLKENFVDKGVLKIDFVRWYRDLYALHKSISHGEITNMKGTEIDEWQDRAEKFLVRMTQIIDDILEKRSS